MKFSMQRLRCLWNCEIKAEYCPRRLPLARMRQMLEFSTAEPLDDAFCAMLLEETRFVDRDDQWRVQLDKALQGSQVEGFKVLIVGAGMSGICSAAKTQSRWYSFFHH